MLVFCVDVSGSMSSWTEVERVSRLRAAQAAVTQQLQTLAKDTPNRRVALLTFESAVCIYGDGIYLQLHLEPMHTCNI